MAYKFPPPPALAPGVFGKATPARVAQMNVVACDGAGVFLQLDYAEDDPKNGELIALSLPAAVKLSEILSDAVDDYIYKTGEKVT